MGFVGVVNDRKECQFDPAAVVSLSQQKQHHQLNLFKPVNDFFDPGALATTCANCQSVLVMPLLGTNYKHNKCVENKEKRIQLRWGAIAITHWCIED